MIPIIKMCSNGSCSQPLLLGAVLGNEGPALGSGEAERCCCGARSPPGSSPSACLPHHCSGGNNPGGGELPEEGISLPVPPASQLSWLFFFFNFILFPSPFLATPSLLLLEMFHLLWGRQGEGSRNSLKTEKDFAKTGRLSGRKKPNSGCQHVFFLPSLPSALAFLLLLFCASSSSLKFCSCCPPLSGWRWRGADGGHLE